MVITPRDAKVAVLAALVAGGVAYLAFVPVPAPAPATPDVPTAVQPAAPAVTTPTPAPVTTTQPKTTTAPKPAPKPAPETLIPHEGYNETVKELVLTAAKLDSGVSLRWTASTSAAFQGYRVVRSLDNPTPYFPQDSYIRAAAERTNVSYVDAGAAKGKTYTYRVCAVIKNGVPTCGNVVKISL